MNKLTYRQVKLLMKLRKLYFNDKLFNKVQHHNKRGESLKHFICKSIISKILNDLNLFYLTEFEFPNKCRADIYILNNNSVIELESSFTEKKENLKLLNFKQYVKKVTVIDLENISNDIFEAEKQLLKKVVL